MGRTVRTVNVAECVRDSAGCESEGERVCLVQVGWNRYRNTSLRCMEEWAAECLLHDGDQVSKKERERREKVKLKIKCWFVNKTQSGQYYFQRKARGKGGRK